MLAKNTFESYVWSFIKQYRLFEAETPLVVAVSTGLDSMALLTLITELYQQGKLEHKPSVLHVNHQTRSISEHLAETELIADFCDEHDLELIVESHYGESKTEHDLREFRQALFKHYAKQLNARILTAHHIDDSFEWSLMQSMKSGSLKASLGIPVINRHLVRPFMCVTKDQIQSYIRQTTTPHLEDSSNEDISYERNYVRNLIIPQIKMRYPKYLKNYVFQKTELAKKLNLHRLGSNVELVIQKIEGGVVIFREDLERDFGSYFSEIRAIIENLSDKKRGKLNSQIRKLIAAVQTGQAGPLSFSGGVKAYLFKSMIYFTKGELQHLQPQFQLPLKMNFHQYSAYLKSQLQDRKLKKFSEFFVAVGSSKEADRLASKLRHIISEGEKPVNFQEKFALYHSWKRQKKDHNSRLTLHFFELSDEGQSSSY